MNFCYYFRRTTSELVITYIILVTFSSACFRAPLQFLVTAVRTSLGYQSLHSVGGAQYVFVVIEDVRSCHTVSAHRPTHTPTASHLRIQMVYKIIIPTALTQIAISVAFGVCRYYIARRNSSLHSIMCQQHLLVRHRLFASHSEQGTSKFGQIVIACSVHSATPHVPKATRCHVRQSQFHLASCDDVQYINMHYLSQQNERRGRRAQKSGILNSERSKRLLGFYFQCIGKSKTDYPS